MECQLTPRQTKILWATIQSYVATAEPVGSKTLANQYNLGVSTATIRNDLALLEQGGLLFQPHTSAGRVPSDSGYRVYVNNLLESDTDPTQHDLFQMLSERLRDQLGEDLDGVLSRAARILAKLSGCIAVIMAPETRSAVIHHIQLVAVDAERIMVIMVTNTYQTQSVLVNLAEVDPEGEIISNPLDHLSVDELSQELQVLSNFFSLKLRGKRVQELQDLSWLELDQAFQFYADWLRYVFKQVAKKCLTSGPSPLYTSGVTELMRQPEFAQTQQVQSVLQLIEDNQSELTEILWLDQPSQLAIYIGTENSLESIHHCTLMTSTYHRHDQSVGSISLLGPTRMAYRQSIAAIQAAAAYLSEAMTP